MSFPERLCYGARDLRRIYNGHLFAAMIVSVCFHMALIGLYVAGPGSAGAKWDATERSDTLIVLPTPDGMIEQWTEVTEVRRLDPGPEPPPRIIGCPRRSYSVLEMDTGRTELLHSGNPVAVSDSLFEPCYMEFINGSMKTYCPHEPSMP